MLKKTIKKIVYHKILKHAIPDWQRTQLYQIDGGGLLSHHIQSHTISLSFTTVYESIHRIIFHIYDCINLNKNFHITVPVPLYIQRTMYTLRHNNTNQYPKLITIDSITDETRERARHKQCTNYYSACWSHFKFYIKYK